MSKKPEFPNNWKKFKDAPPEMFFCPTWEEFSTWKLEGWEIPESVYCIIRAEIDGKVRNTRINVLSLHKTRYRN